MKPLIRRLAGERQPLNLFRRLIYKRSQTAAEEAEDGRQGDGDSRARAEVVVVVVVAAAAVGAGHGRRRDDVRSVHSDFVDLQISCFHVQDADATRGCSKAV